MRARVLAVLGLELVLVAGALLPPVAGAADVRVVRLDGVPVRLLPGTTQVITVNRTSGTHARIVFWQFTARGWVSLDRSPRARIGYGGLVAPTQRRQNTGTTPIGTYTLPFAFGSRARQPAWRLAYRRFDGNDYWVEDNASRFYNRYRSRELGGFRWWLDARSVNGSERLADYPRQYEMAVVIAFNYDRPVRYRGAGIFLHVNGSGPTAGCVSAPRAFLAFTLRTLHPDQRPLIAIGR
jgi:L,D-peptidoglycan transpeptidase YkuD (ErfK/YbiS/YcfS/YnhG family)